jgi:LmbE family N-acetylglucosaminyl deacetylase
VAGRARPHLRVIHRRLLVAKARDITDSTADRSALVLAPHPDDETIGCGATIARKAASGTRVRVVVATDGGDPRRRNECAVACRNLGLGEDDVSFLGLPDGALADHGPELEAMLHPVVQETAADDLFVPSAIDAHADHRALAAAVDRLRPRLASRMQVLAYPIWFWNRWAWVQRTTPRWQQRMELTWRPVAFTAGCRARVVRTEEFATMKLAAIQAHESQIDASVAGESKVLDPEWLAMFMGADEVFFEI